MHRDVVHAVPDLGLGVGDAFGLQAAVDRLPRLAAVRRTEGPGRGDSDVHPLRVARVEDDRVQAHAARARLPLRSRAVLAQTRQLLPRLTAVDRAEQRGVFDAGIDGVGIGQRGLEVPHPRELPWVRGAVVPLVGAGHARVAEVVAYGVPRLAAVVGALDDLAVPARRLGRVDAVGIRR